MSSKDFIAETEQTRKAIGLLNSLEVEKLPLLAQRIAAKIHSSTEAAFKPDELEKLGKSLSLELDSVHEVISMIEFIYQQASYEMIKPSVLNAKLIALKLDEDKASALSEIWRVDGKAIMERMRQTRTISATRLRDVNWRLNLTLASEVKSRQKAPNALFEFNLADSNNPNSDQSVHVEFDRDELHEFLNKLDVIQKQIDSLSSA